MLTIEWRNSIGLIQRDDWVTIYGDDDIYNSYEFHKAVEDAKLEGVRHTYLCVFEDNDLLALIPTFTYSLSLLESENVLVKKTLDCIKKYYRRFLSIRVFCLGIPLTNNKDYIGIRSGLSQDRQGLLLSRVKEEVVEKSKELHCKILLLKDVTWSRLDYMQQSFLEYQYFEAPPNAYFPVIGESFFSLTKLKSKQRNRIKGIQRSIADEKLEFKLEFDKDLSAEFYALYDTVYQKSEYKFIPLNEGFFHALKASLGEHCFFLQIFDKDGVLRCMVLFLDSNDAMITKYIGLDYEYADCSLLYNAYILKSIEIAESRKKTLLLLGQTAYHPKISSGAVLERMYVGLNSTSFLYRYLIKYFMKLRYPPFKISQKYAYKEKDARSIVEFMHSKGIDVIENTSQS